jgi:hypothetical protein
MSDQCAWKEATNRSSDGAGSRERKSLPLLGGGAMFGHSVHADVQIARATRKVRMRGAKFTR